MKTVRWLPFLLPMWLGACATQHNALGDSEQARAFAPLAFLVGEWEGTGAGANGQSMGTWRAP
jgi:hypothetical protein